MKQSNMNETTINSHQTNTKLPDLDINLSHLYDIHTERDLSD